MDKTVCELFAGVGGFRLGLERASKDWKIVWMNQWEPSRKKQDAFECYCKHFGGYKNTYVNRDIREITKTEIPDHNLLVAGFPCQDYSVASVNARGLNGKKGVLWWQIQKVLKAKKPSFVLLENVDRLLKSPASQRGRDFGVILACFANLGYSVEWRVINAADYGAAQRRRRTFIFAYRNDTVYGQNIRNYDSCDVIVQRGFMTQSFPIIGNKDIVVGNLGNFMTNDDIINISNNFVFAFNRAGYMYEGNIYTCDITENKVQPILLQQVLQENVEEEFYIADDKKPEWIYLKGAKKIPRKTKDGYKYTFSEGSIAFPDPYNKPSRTILTSEAMLNRSTHVVSDLGTGKLRVLTPIEVERLQGFEDNWTNTGMSKRMRYFCMGNALVVPIVTRMGKTLNIIFNSEH